MLSKSTLLNNCNKFKLAKHGMPLHRQALIRCAKSMKTVPPNIFTWVIRIVLLPATIWLVAYPLYRLLNNEYANERGEFIFVGIFFFVLFLLANVLSLLGVFKIRYEPQSKDIEFCYLFKSRTVLVNEINGYYLTTLKTKWKNYSGYILLLNDGSSIEITEYNTSPLRDFYAFIVQSGVPCKGYKNSWYPLKRGLRTTVRL